MSLSCLFWLCEEKEGKGKGKEKEKERDRKTNKHRAREKGKESERGLKVKWERKKGWDLREERNGGNGSDGAHVGTAKSSVETWHSMGHCQLRGFFFFLFSFGFLGYRMLHLQLSQPSLPEIMEGGEKKRLKLRKRFCTHDGFLVLCDLTPWISLPKPFTFSFPFSRSVVFCTQSSFWKNLLLQSLLLVSWFSCYFPTPFPLIITWSLLGVSLNSQTQFHLFQLFLNCSSLEVFCFKLSLEVLWVWFFKF